MRIATICVQRLALALQMGIICETGIMFVYARTKQRKMFELQLWREKYARQKYIKHDSMQMQK